MRQHTPDSDNITGVLNDFIRLHRLPNSYLELALKWFIPLAEKIKTHHDEAKHPLLVAVNGCQGSGKSTLTELLVGLFRQHYKMSAIGFSIDDFYLSKQQRTQLSMDVHPLLKTRGVPGTHNCEMMNDCLGALLNRSSTTIPSFDKSQDDLYPVQQWKQVDEALDIIIFEGWCVGSTAQDERELLTPVNELERHLDPDGSWRRFVNNKLANEYQQVFNKIDYQVMLKAPSFAQVYGWRCEQEHKLKIKLLAESKTTGAHKLKSMLMSDEEIHKFIQFYQRLTEHTLTSMPPKCDSLYILNSTRSIEACQHQ